MHNPNILHHPAHHEDLDWQDLKVGHQYLYEESYYIQGIFLVVEDRSTAEHSAFLIRLVRHLGGIAQYEPGAEVEFVVSRLKHERKYDYMMKQRFRYVGAEGEYAFIPSYQSHDAKTTPATA